MDPDQPVSVLGRLRLLLGIAGRVRRQLWVSVALAVVATALQLAPYYLLYRAVDAIVAGTASRGGLFALALVSAACIAGRFVLWATAMWISHVASADIERSLRVDVTTHVARLPMGWFGTRRSGELKKLLAEDLGRLELFVAHAVPEVVSALVWWLAVTVWLFVVDWRLAAAVLATVPVAFALLVLSWRGTAEKLAEAEAASSRMNGSIVELLVGLPVLKVFRRAEDALVETRRTIEHFAHHQTEWSREYVPLATAFYQLVTYNVVAVVVVGLPLAATGAVGTSSLLLFLLLGLGYGLPLMRFYTLGAFATFMASAAMLIQQVLDEEPLPDTGRRVELDGAAVEFRDVSFGYGDGGRVLHQVSFTATEGAVTALVGPSGAGKTTVARLVARFADPDEGAVLLGGVDLRAVAVDQLMENVAVVAQDPFLFHDSIEANIRVGRAGATGEEVRAAARAARAHDFVEALPDGYATVVGERGSTLSGGQRQRITIARALLKDAPVVVLDEATAFADPESEAEIQAAIGALVVGRTLIVVAHRLQTVVAADRIVALDGGRVVASGTHAENLAGGGRYLRMWEDATRATPPPTVTAVGR